MNGLYEFSIYTVEPIICSKNNLLIIRINKLYLRKGNYRGQTLNLYLQEFCLQALKLLLPRPGLIKILSAGIQFSLPFCLFH